MAFIETFLATSTTLLCAWIFKKFIEPWLEKSHNKTKRIMKIIGGKNEDRQKNNRRIQEQEYKED